MNKHSLFLKSFLATLLLIAGLASYGLLLPATMPANGVIYYVAPGASRTAVVSELAANKVIRSQWIFDLYTSLSRKPPKSGEYLIKRGTSPYALWKQLLAGTGRYYRSFTIIPGTSFKQIKQNIEKTTTLRQITVNMTDDNIMLMMGDKSRNPEGMFMPETYYYSRGDADLAVLKRAYDLMLNKLNEAWLKRAPNLPYKTEYEALIAASLIEKEAHLASEQPIIAGVLINRLNKSMLLQFDPTVIYGMGDEYQGKIYKRNLTTDTPYNTYVHKGLPPTPIAMPGLNAIVAALHPEQHEYLYFVASGNGAHTFTTNLDAHHAAVQKAASNKAAPKGVPNAAS